MKISGRLLLVLVLIVLFSATVHADKAPQTRQTDNVIFVMADGLRWQDVFTGAAEVLLGEKGGDADLARLRYWRKTPEARREALMPFFWNVIAKQGQVFGNQDKGSVAQVTNGMNFSYPGYSETLCGFADPRIDSNKKNPNPNVTVLEWLNGIDRFRGRVAVFGAWDLFPYIVNRERSGLLVNAGYEPMENGRVTPACALLNRLKEETIHYWQAEPFDSLTFETALEYFKTRKPRVLYLSLGETDEWGHEGRYDLYLESAHLADAFVKSLWETAQSMRRYRGKTTLVFSTDHGRGHGPEWKSHGDEIKGSENIWMAFLGPDTPALGERTNTERIGQNQIAATLAALLGQDYCAAQPKAGRTIAGVCAPRND